MPYPVWLKSRLGFLRPAVQWARRRRTRLRVAEVPRLRRGAREAVTTVRRAAWEAMPRRALISELERSERRHLLELERVRRKAASGGGGLTRKAVRRQIEALKTEIANIERHQYGSYTPGTDGWAERWAEAEGRRVVLFARKDFSGSFYRWAEAINRHTPFAARLAVLERHPYGYVNDLVFPLPELADSELERLLAEADIIHLKDENGFIDGSTRLPDDIFTRPGKPRVFTHYGGFARSLEADSAYREYVQAFDARVAMTPDLNYEWFDGAFIPHAIDLVGTPYDWHDSWLVTHSPSNPERKGTDDFLAAVEVVRRRFPEIELDLIHGVPHAECLLRKRKGTLFFDQAGREARSSLGVDTVIGWYGNSALEAAVSGIPTIAHMSEAAYEGAARAGVDLRHDCGILNTDLGTEGLAQTLGSFFERSTEDRTVLAKASRTWVEQFHSYEAVAARLEDLYGGLT